MTSTPLAVEPRNEFKQQQRICPLHHPHTSHLPPPLCSEPQPADCPGQQECRESMEEAN